MFSPHFRPGGGLPPRKGGNEAAATLPSPSGTASSGYRKRTWRPRHPAKRLKCIQDFRPASLPPTAALKRASLPSLHQALRSGTFGGIVNFTLLPPSVGLLDAQISAFHQDFPNQFLGISETLKIKDLQSWQINDISATRPPFLAHGRHH